MANVKYKEAQRKILDFLSTYGDMYPAHVKRELIKCLKEDTELEVVADFIYQLYSHFELIPQETNRYFGLLNKLSNNYDVNCDILEIGGGFFPAFAKELSNIQQRGSVTVYDPRLVVLNFENLRLVKNSFSHETDIDGYDLLVAICPCSATETIIEKANNEHKEFFIALCGCDHTPYAGEYYGYSYTRWENYILDKLENTLEDNAYVDVDYIDRKYEYPYPVLMKKYQSK